MSKATGGAGGIGGAVAYLAGLRDPEAIVAVGVISAAVPAFGIGLIAGGGLFGWTRALLFGHRD